MKKTIIILITLLIAPLLFLSQQSSVNNVNGFTADPGSFEILNRFQGRNNVLKIERAKTNWFIANYSLAQYRGKTIAIEFSADVWLEGSTNMLLWNVTDHPNYPRVSMLSSATAGQWNNMRGRIIVTPTQSNAALSLNKYGHPENTIFYIANPTVTITEGINYTPDLSLTPLKDIYANDFLIGNIIDWDGRYNSGRHFDLLNHHFNIVSPGAILTSSYLAPLTKGGEYRFSDADNLINHYIGNNIQVYGHVLVWHMEPPPNWFFEGTRDEIIQNMNDYITTVFRHFRGRINTWEVVNEAVRDGLTARDVRGDWRNCLNDSQNRTNIWSPRNMWFEKLGADYIELAFRAARAADPNIKLYYNDNNLEEQPNKAEVVRKMIQDINDRYKRETGGTRNLIEGVGTQTHIWNLNQNINDVRNALDKLTSLGIEISITELDIPGNFIGIQRYGYDTDMSERDAINQGLLYARLMQLFKEYSAHITRVTFWGLDDNTSWISNGNPNLFDWKLNAKPAFHAVSDPEGFIRQHGGRTRR